jgi:hypothetical protein
MDDNLLFRWIWRFNALGIAGLVILFGASFLPFLLRGYTNQAVIFGGPEPTALDEQSPLQLNMYGVVDGMGVVLFAYGQSNELPRGGSFSGSHRAANRNFLFYALKTRSKRWLFPSNGQEITSVDYVREDGTAEQAAPTIGPDGLPLPPSRPVQSPQQATVRAVLFDVRPAAKTDAKVAYQMYATRPDGSGVTKLLDELDEPGEFTPIDAETIVVANKRGGRTYATTISLADFKTIAEIELTKDLPK